LHTATFVNGQLVALEKGRRDKEKIEKKMSLEAFILGFGLFWGKR
jgi:hypothetical protein